MARGYIPEDEIPYTNPKNDRQLALNALARCIIITEALNGGEVPDFDNRAEKKYCIKWHMGSEGPGFIFVNEEEQGVRSESFIGARFVFFDPKVAYYAAMQFRNEYMAWMTISKDGSHETGDFNSTFRNSDKYRDWMVAPALNLSGPDKE